MPTTQVGAGSEALLQGIADSLLKSKKVIIVTGAGISTNSGIPDFRSENGLYSMIQAQFDSFAKQDASKSLSRPGVVDAGNYEPEGRSAKRRKVSTAPQDSIEVLTSPVRDVEPPLRESSQEERSLGSQNEPETRCELSPCDDIAHAGKGGIKEDGEVSHDARSPSPGPSLRSSPPPAASASRLDFHDAPLLPPGTPRFLRSSRREQPTTQDSSTPSTPHQTSQSDLQTDSFSSSPLSSPPHILFDPYSDETLTDSRTASEPSSPVSESSESSPTAQSYLAVQASNLKSSSLPNLKGRDLFDASIWADPLKTSVFYTFTTTLRQKSKDASPTSCHHFIANLRNLGKLVRCYTQNIDQMERRVGLSDEIGLGPGHRSRFFNRGSRASGVVATGASSATAEPALSAAGDPGDRPGSTSTTTAPALAGLPAAGGPGDRSGPTSATTAAAVAKSPDGDNRQPSGGAGTGEPCGEPGVLAPSGRSGVRGMGPHSGQRHASLPKPPISTTPTTHGLGGSPPNSGVEVVCLHGSLHALRCFQCGRITDWDEANREMETMSGRQPPCPHCEGATVARQERGKRALGVGKLRPDIVLYGEEHPDAHLISPIVQHDLSLMPDMLLILGTSLRVHGLKVIVKEFAKAVHNKGGKVVFVNFTKPPDSVWADIIDFWVDLDCDAWVSDLKLRKPVLWLPPGSVTEEEEKQTVRKNEKSASKKKETPKVTKPEPKRPAAVRDNKQNGAYLTMNILAQLAKISGRDDNMQPPAALHLPYSTLRTPAQPKSAASSTTQTPAASKASTSATRNPPLKKSTSTLSLAQADGPASTDGLGVSALSNMPTLSNAPVSKPRRGPRLRNARSRKPLAAAKETTTNIPKAKTPRASKSKALNRKAVTETEPNLTKGVPDTEEPSAPKPKIPTMEAVEHFDPNTITTRGMFESMLRPEPPPVIATPKYSLAVSEASVPLPGSAALASGTSGDGPSAEGRTSLPGVSSASSPAVIEAPAPLPKSVALASKVTNDTPCTEGRPLLPEVPHVSSSATAPLPGTVNPSSGVSGDGPSILAVVKSRTRKPKRLFGEDDTPTATSLTRKATSAAKARPKSTPRPRRPAQTKKNKPKMLAVTIPVPSHLSADAMGNMPMTAFANMLLPDPRRPLSSGIGTPEDLLMPVPASMSLPRPGETLIPDQYRVSAGQVFTQGRNPFRASSANGHIYIPPLKNIYSMDGTPAPRPMPLEPRPMHGSGPLATVSTSRMGRSPSMSFSPQHWQNRAFHHHDALENYMTRSPPSIGDATPQFSPNRAGERGIQAAVWAWSPGHPPGLPDSERLMMQAQAQRDNEAAMTLSYMCGGGFGATN